jgi:5'-nucleotidase-like protein
MRPLLASALLATASLSGLAQQSDYRYRVIYTGRLLGYARVPDVQQFDSKSGAGEPNPFARLLLNQLAADAAGSDAMDLRVLVGMGDNLAPDLYARSFGVTGARVPNCDTGQPLSQAVHVPKDFFRYDASTESWTSVCGSFNFPAPFFDNAAEFFIRAQYDALVPGKHDFYLGAQHLRELGAFLELHRVRMLAANLVISTSRATGVLNAHAPIPEGLRSPCHDDFTRHDCFHTDFSPSSVDLPDAVLPWKQRFVIKNARRPQIRGSNGEVFRADEISRLKPGQAQLQDVRDWNRTFICIEPGPETNSDPTAVLVPGHRCWQIRPARDLCIDPLPAHLTSTCRAIYGPNGIYDAGQDKGSPDLTFLWAEPRAHLVPGLNHMLCVDLQPGAAVHPGDAGSWPTCQPFSVQAPFFWPDTSSQTGSGTAACDSAASPGLACPFALASRAGKTVAILAVVDPDLLTNVGMLNATWLNRKKSWDTSTAVLAPDEALSQTLELCASIEPCRTAPKILLAQMSYARASQLLTYFDKAFDAVISESDPAHGPAVSSINVEEPEPHFVLTPAIPFYTDPETGHPYLKPTIFEARLSKRANKTWTLENRPLGLSIPAAIPASEVEPPCKGTEKGCTNLQRFSRAVLTATNRLTPPAKNPLTQPAAGADFTEVALAAMRDRLDTDIAVLQERDFFAGDLFSLERLAAPRLQDEISKVLWKGDFISKLHVTGATLRSLLKESADFETADQNPLSTEVEQGRSLVTLGISHDANDPSVYYVNGLKLDDQSLYTVAATDFLSAGDTGYAALASPDVPPPMRPRQFDKGPIALAGVVCSAIAAHIAEPDSACIGAELGAGYLDSSAARPLSATAGFNTLKHYRAFPHYFDVVGPLGSKAEQSVQQRKFWSLNLENLDFGESGVFIDHVIRTTSLLAGISTPGVAQNDTSNIAADHRARLTYDFRKGTFYLLSDSSFLSTRTGPGSLSISTNMLGSEAGGTMRIPWQRPSWLSLQYSVRYERELAEPPSSIFTFNLPASQLPPNATSQPQLTLPTPKTSDLYGRLGMRTESKDTYFEAGIEKIEARGLLQNYGFNIGGQPVYCEPAASAAYLCGIDPRSNSPTDLTPMASDVALTSAGVKAIAHTANYLNTGFYLNFKWQFPLVSRRDAAGVDRSVYFTLTNKGDFYFNSGHDTPVQTRYLTQLTPAFVVPIWGHISLTPKIDFILFENKVNFFHYRAIQPSVTLSYTFHFREGMAWRRAVGFGAQTTTPSAAGSLP